MDRIKRVGQVAVKAFGICFMVYLIVMVVMLLYVLIGLKLIY